MNPLDLESLALFCLCGSSCDQCGAAQTPQIWSLIAAPAESAWESNTDGVLAGTYHLIKS